MIAYIEGRMDRSERTISRPDYDRIDPYSGRIEIKVCIMSPREKSLGHPRPLLQEVKKIVLRATSAI